MHKSLTVILGIEGRFRAIFGVTLALLMTTTTILLLNVLPKVDQVYRVLPQLTQENFANYAFSITIVGAVATFVLVGIYLYRRRSLSILRIVSLAILSILFGVMLAVGIPISAAMSRTSLVVRLPMQITMFLLLVEYAICVVARMVKTNVTAY